MFQIDSSTEIVFLTLLIPENYENEIRTCSTGTMQDAASSFQWNIYNGLTKNLKKNPIKIFNILPIGSFPQYYKKCFINTTNFATSSSMNNVNIGFCNLKLFRRYSQVIKVYRELDKWCKSSTNKILIIYTINSTYMTVVNKLKKRYPNLKTCAIVADLPNMVSLSSKKTILKLLYEKVSSRKSYKYLNIIDCYVLLTKFMADYLKIKQPYCIVEGISTVTNTKCISRKPKHILYSGTLHKRFGIINLLKAFEKIEDPEYRLYLCGTGDSEEEIIKFSKKDPRIFFLGQIKRDSVIELQQTMSILINPRQNVEEFTKYSFPSKNLEYLSSGIPLIAYKLDGIPEDYDPFINYVKDNTVDSLQLCIQTICEDCTGYFMEKAKKGKMYVLKEKNDVKQTKKIIRLLEELYEN